MCPQAINVADGQRLYPAKTTKDCGTITRDTVREILDELPESIGGWQEQPTASRDVWIVRTIGVTSDDPGFAQWKASIPPRSDCMS